MFLALYSCLSVLGLSINNDLVSVNSSNDFSVCVYCEKFDLGDLIKYVKQRFVLRDNKIKHYSTIFIFYYKGCNSGVTEIFVQKNEYGNHIIQWDYSKAKSVRTTTTETSPWPCGVNFYTYDRIKSILEAQFIYRTKWYFINSLKSFCENY